jgi:hypothetical protein
MRFFNSKEEVLDIQLTQYGRQLYSKGMWKPVYYAFYDEGVLYDANYGGVSETKNEAEARIQDETPSLRTQTGFTGREEYLFDGVDDELEQELIGAYEKLNVLTYPLGSSTLDSTKTPAFDIYFLQGEITGLLNNSTGSLASGKIKSASQQILKIPQIQSDIEFKITTYDPANPKLPFVEDPELTNRTIFDDDHTIAIGPEQILLFVEENNAPFDYENFDIEVYEITDETGPTGEQILKPLSFIRPLETVENNILIDREEAEIKAGRVNGQLPDIDPSYVQYYFDINVDSEIGENLICRSVSQLRSKNIIIDTDIRCPDIVEPIRSNIYFSDAEDDECLDN